MKLAHLLGIRSDASADSRPMRIAPPLRERHIIGTNGALALDSVYRSVQIIQVAASQLTLDAWRDTTPLTGRAYPAYLAHPWEDADQTDLVSEIVASLALRGNAYVRVVRDDAGQVVGLRPLDPLECTPLLSPKSNMRTVQWCGKTYGPRDIAHLRLLRVPGEAEGLGPIQACVRQINGALEMSGYASEWIKNGGVPTGILSTDQQINAEKAREQAAIWNERNSHDGGVAVLGAGLKYQPLALKPEEIQFIESRQFDAVAIARMFGIPSHLSMTSAGGSNLTYQNIQDADLSFIRWTEMAYLRPIETGLSKVLNGKVSVRFNLDAFLRPDTATRYATYKTGIEGGFITPQWVQETEGITIKQEQGE